jgi:hypothetical protein
MNLLNRNLKWSLAAVVLTTAAMPSQSIAEAKRPNILLIICDDLNDSIEGMGGHPQAKTPNIDRLTAQGVRFVNAQANVPLRSIARGHHEQ